MGPWLRHSEGYQLHDRVLVRRKVVRERGLFIAAQNMMLWSSAPSRSIFPTHTPSAMFGIATSRPRETRAVSSALMLGNHAGTWPSLRFSFTPPFPSPGGCPLRLCSVTWKWTRRSLRRSCLRCSNGAGVLASLIVSLGVQRFLKFGRCTALSEDTTRAGGLNEAGCGTNESYGQCGCCRSPWRSRERDGLQPFSSQDITVTDVLCGVVSFRNCHFSYGYCLWIIGWRTTDVGF